MTLHLCPVTMVTATALSVLSSHATDSVTDFVFFADHSMKNKLNFNDTLYNGSARSTRHCAVLCASSEPCLSFHYNNVTRECVSRESVTGKTSSSIEEQNWELFIKYDSRATWRDFRDHKYFYLPGLSRSWEDAKIICEGIGAYLVEIDDIDEQTFLNNEVSALTFIWIGLYSPGNNGTFVWANSGQIPQYVDWANMDSKYRGCAVHRSGGKWRTRNCDLDYALLCERS